MKRLVSLSCILMFILFSCAPREIIATSTWTPVFTEQNDPNKIGSCNKVELETWYCEIISIKEEFEERWNYYVSPSTDPPYKIRAQKVFGRFNDLEQRLIDLSIPKCEYGENEVADRVQYRLWMTISKAISSAKSAKEGRVGIAGDYGDSAESNYKDMLEALNEFYFYFRLSADSIECKESGQ